MRWIVVALLMVNLGVFIWKTTEQHDERRAVAPAPVEQRSGVARLPLLTELDADALRERRKDAADETASDAAGAEAGEGGETTIAQGRSCFTLGPFKPGDAMRDGVRTWLRGRVSAVSLRQDERRELALYWVYFPPAESREAAADRLAELKAKGVTDVLVVPKGDMANAISLGVYSKAASRDRRVREMKAKGYEPEVADRYRTVKADWLDVALDPEMAFDSTQFASEFPGLELESAPCKRG